MRIGPIPTINKYFSLHTREWERTARLGLEQVKIKWKYRKRKINLSILTYEVFIVHSLWNVPGQNNKNIGLYKQSNYRDRMRYTQATVHRRSIILFIFHYWSYYIWPPKPTGLIKYKLQEGILPYQKEISFQAVEILLAISYWNLWLSLQCDLQCSLVLSFPIECITRWFHFFWFLTEK